MSDLYKSKFFSRFLNYITILSWGCINKPKIKLCCHSFPYGTPDSYLKQHPRLYQKQSFPSQVICSFRFQPWMSSITYKILAALLKFSATINLCTHNYSGRKILDGIGYKSKPSLLYTSGRATFRKEEYTPLRKYSGTLFCQVKRYFTSVLGDHPGLFTALFIHLS